MPHTNRRKKPLRVKRTEITDEDGWTRVTTTNPNQRTPRPLSVQAAIEKRSEGRKIINAADYENATPKPGTTVEKLEEQYRGFEKRWLASESWKELDDILRNKVDRATLQSIDRCVVFGTGSYCGVLSGWIERFDVSLFQLAVFKTMRDTIEEVTGTRPPSFAQDPIYNELDAQLLERLNIEKVDNPQGFHVVTPNTLIYAPAAELSVELRALAANPAVALVTGKLDFFWRNDNGEACTNRITYGGPDGKLFHEITEADGEESFARKTHMKDELEEGLSVLEEFKQNRDCFAVRELDVKDSPFWSVHVYSRQTADDIEQVES